MADQITIPPTGTGDATPVVAVDKDAGDGGKAYQILKVAWGALHTAYKIVDNSAANALPVNIVAGGGSGGTSQIDKSTFTEGTSAFTPVGGVFNETIGSDPTEDQAAALRITAKRGLHVNLRDAGGNQLGDAVARALFLKLTDGVDVAAIDASGNVGVFLGAALDRSSAPTLSDGGAARLLEINAENSAFTNAFPAWVGRVRSTKPTLTNGNTAGLWLTTDGRLVIGLGQVMPSTGLTLQAALIDIATAGDNAVIAGVANQAINIYGIEYFANGAVNITLKNGTTGAPPTLLPVQDFTANQGVIRDLRGDPWFAGRANATATDNSFVINLSGAVQVSGKVFYTQG